MSCSIRIAAESAKCGQPEVKLGVIPGYGGTQRMPRLVGRGRALKLILSGDIIDATEAYRIGLVDELVPDAHVIERAETVLKKIIANAPLSVKYALEPVNKRLETSMPEGLLIRASLFPACASTHYKKKSPP